MLRLQRSRRMGRREVVMMTAVFRIKSYSAVEIESLISLMNRNGYRVIFEKGDRVSTKVIIHKDGQEYVGITEDEE